MGRLVCSVDLDDGCLEVVLNWNLHRYSRDSYLLTNSIVSVAHIVRKSKPGAGLRCVSEKRSTSGNKFGMFGMLETDTIGIPGYEREREVSFKKCSCPIRYYKRSITRQASTQSMNLSVGLAVSHRCWMDLKIFANLARSYGSKKAVTTVKS